MSDYIDREKAIDYLMEIIDRPNHPEWLWTDEICGSLNAIPAADVRPVVRGKWKVSVHKTYYDVSCSVCGINSFFQVDEKDSISYANFCPNCGADMREES